MNQYNWTENALITRRQQFINWFVEHLTIKRNAISPSEADEMLDNANQILMGIREKTPASEYGSGLSLYMAYFCPNDSDPTGLLEDEIPVDNSLDGYYGNCFKLKEPPKICKCMCEPTCPFEEDEEECEAKFLKSKKYIEGNEKSYFGWIIGFIVLSYLAFITRKKKVWTSGFFALWMISGTCAYSLDSSNNGDVALVNDVIFSDIHTLLSQGEELPSKVSIDIRHKELVGLTLEFDEANHDKVLKSLCSKYGTFDTESDIAHFWKKCSINNIKDDKYSILLSRDSNKDRCQVEFIKVGSAIIDPKDGKLKYK